MFLAWLAGAVQAQDKYPFRASGYLGLGGAVNDDQGGSFSNGSYQLGFSWESDYDILVGVRVGQVAFDDGPSGRAGSDLTYATIGGEYLFNEGYYTSGIYFALGYYGLDDDELPEPAQNRPDLAFVEPPPPPPPPPPRSKPEPTATPSVRKRPAVEKAMPTEARPPAEAPLEAVRIGGSIPEPRKLKNVNPVYPPEAVQARVQGVVILECTIDPTGRVVKTKVLRGIPLLTEAAVAAVGQWEYTPTLLNGVPVPVIMTVVVTFGIG